MRGTERGRLEGDRRVLQVSDVLRAIEDQFSIAFPRRVWVFGTVRGLRGGDHQEFVLTEASAELTGDDTPRTLPSELDPAAHEDVDASLRRLHDVAVEDLLVEGHLVRAGGLLSYDTSRHTVVFSITALDPQPTSAWLDDRRQAVREAVDEARLSERQRDVQVPLAPRTIGIVGTVGDPTLDEVRGALHGSDFAVDVVEYRVRETGARMGEGIAAALREASRADHDVVLLVRQYGRPLALAPYDDEAVIRAVATAPVPVLSGLGAPDAPAAVESVAHQAFPTAHELADALLRKLQRADAMVGDELERVAEAGDDAIRRAGRRVEQVRASVIEDIRAARARAEAARKRRLLLIRSLAAVLAVVVVLVAVLTGTYALLALLVVPLGLVVFGDRFRSQRRRGPVSVRDLTFAAALERLGGIRRDLQDVADPDAVDALEAEADALAEHCRGLLRRPRRLRGGRGDGASEGPPVAASPSAPSQEEREPHLFDQFASDQPGNDRSGTDRSGTDDAPTTALRRVTDDDAPRDADTDPGRTVETRRPADDTTAGNAGGDSPTEALGSGPRRTITLPGDGDATQAIPTTPVASNERDDDAPTSVLPPR